MKRQERAGTSHSALIAAFAAVYIIWGSTYLAIRFAVETLPPFLMAGTRFLIAGTVLYAWATAHGAPKPDRRTWTAAAIAGVLLLVGGNGGVTWAEQIVPSSLAALLIATEPLWIVVLDWLRPGGTRPAALTAVGVALGFGGVALLIGPWSGASSVKPLGVVIILLASLSWAAGSLYARRAPLPSSGTQSSGMQMLVGGLVLLLSGVVSGEVPALATHAVSFRSMLALGYLVIFGSLVAFSAFTWLVQHTTPARVATYAYVNPVVAMGLGWALAGEPITVRTVVAAVIIISAVGLITGTRSDSGTRRAEGRGETKATGPYVVGASALESQ